MDKKEKLRRTDELNRKKRCRWQMVCDEDLAPMTLTCYVDLDHGIVRECQFVGRERSCGEPGNNLIAG